MTLDEIKAAVRAGKIVHWKSPGYVVTVDMHDYFAVVFTPTRNCIGLTWRDGVTMNGEEADFFLANEAVAA